MHLFCRFETGWLMVLKAVVNSKRDIVQVWSSSYGHSLNNSAVINVDGSVQLFYKSRRVNDWESLKPKEVREKTS